MLGADLQTWLSSISKKFHALVAARIMLGVLAPSRTTFRTSSCSIAPYDASARCTIEDQCSPLLCLM